MVVSVQYGVLKDSLLYRYVSAGLQAVLELYFVRFLFVCLEGRTSLATTSTNVYIALYQVCAISAGILADKIIGELKDIIKLTSASQINELLCLNSALLVHLFACNYVIFLNLFNMNILSR